VSTRPYRVVVAAALPLAATLASACASCNSGASAGSAGPATPSSGGAAESGAAAGGSTVPLPGGGAGIGFDDMLFAPGIRKVLAPAGATGNLDLVDPDTMEVTAISGFSGSAGKYGGGHGEGTTSADEGRGVLFATDRTAGLLDVVDPAKRAIVASTKLGGGPDYVRWVDATNEVWVTEPDSEVIEVFTVPAGPKPTPSHAMNISIKGGPESLVVDAARKKAFTHLWNGSTVAVDVPTHAPIATWPNGCGGSRGIALDSKRGLLFAGCNEGKLVVLDVDHDGKQLGSVSSGAGVDIIAYDARLAHAYMPGATSATMAIIGIAANGAPTLLGTVPAANGSHCVAADDRAQAWICDPEHGQLLLVKDTYAASGSRSATPL
jgi:hypothetical protein